MEELYHIEYVDGEGEDHNRKDLHNFLDQDQ